MSRPCSLLLRVAALAAPMVPGALGAQDPVLDRGVRCPPAVTSAESIIARIDSIAATFSLARIDPRPGAIGSATAGPFVTTDPCPRFPPEADVSNEAVRLIQHAIGTDNELVVGPMLNALYRAFSQMEDLGPPPIEFLVDAVASGRTEVARFHALNLLVRWSPDDPAAWDAVLGWGRAEIGPPAWPELPSFLMGWLPGSPHDDQAALGRALVAQPERIRNPLGRWLAECGEREQDFYHVPPEPGDRADPCHPANMPAAGRGRSNSNPRGRRGGWLRQTP